MVKKDMAVLVIDDEALILSVVESFLRKSRFSTLLVGNLVDAARLCNDHERTIDIVLTDVTLPARGREAFWALLAERFPYARVIYMSGFPEDQVEGCEWRGPRFFLQKPFTGLILLNVLEKAARATLCAGGC